METKKTSENKYISAGIFAAVAASLCCIAPVLAIIGGIGGIASAFTWLEPLRPYLIGLSVISLSAAFYQAYKPKKEIDCDCETEYLSADKAGKPKFINSKKFLWSITIISAVLLSFPYYSQVLFPKVSTNTAVIKPEYIMEAKFNIEGMTCESCEQSIDYSLKTSDGVLTASSSYKTGVAKVKYDTNKTKADDLAKIITKKTGYKVKDYEVIKKNDGVN